MPTKFFYFDLGNVLLHFSHYRGAEQMAKVAGIDADLAWKIVFGGDLQDRYEAGQVDSASFYAEFCRESGTTPDRAALLAAAGDIFDLNTPIAPVVAQLQAAGYRTGILSNTCECHWRHCTDGRYGLIPGAFGPLVLSYEERSMKPDGHIYEVAIARAQRNLSPVAPGEIFFIDDREENVAGAKAAGIDAVMYTGASACAAELRKRGVEFNY